MIAMIARTARWVDPRAFQALPVWCPDTARGRPQYNSRWTEKYLDRHGAVSVEANIRAGKALMAALGVRGKRPKNWSVCHIWGYDDGGFASQSNIVKDPRYYSCIGNMVWLPTPLKGFTDAVPEIKTILRTCAFHLYGWVCEHPDAAGEAGRIRAGALAGDYPTTWPTANRRITPPGTAPFSGSVIAAIEKQKALIRERLADHSLVHYPRDEVREVLGFWKVNVT